MSAGCGQNAIEQLNYGVNAMHVPVNDLESNWAYMVMAALAWNLKAWFGLRVPNRERGLHLAKMEFRSFWRPYRDRHAHKSELTA